MHVATTFFRKKKLLQHEFKYTWNQQSEMGIALYTIKQRIIDVHCQKWYPNINHSDRLMSSS